MVMLERLTNAVVNLEIQKQWLYTTEPTSDDTV